MKQGVSAVMRNRVIELRRSHSLSEVAKLVGLPIGTVKTICSRSGAFRDNLAHRALFSLPPIKPSAETLPAVQSMPAAKVVTGDDEVDAMLWLQEVVSTGQADLIAKAMAARQRIKTPIKELEDRYRKHLVSAHGNSLAGMFAMINFGDLETLAKKAVSEMLRCNEAEARFGNTLFHATSAEQFCIEALAGLELCGKFHEFDSEQAAARFMAHPDLMPHTLDDCLHELEYWKQLWELRSAVDFESADSADEVWARKMFVFAQMALIRPRSAEEAISVFRLMVDQELMDWKESNLILENLIGQPIEASKKS